MDQLAGKGIEDDSTNSLISDRSHCGGAEIDEDVVMNSTVEQLCAQAPQYSVVIDSDALKIPAASP